MDLTDKNDFGEGCHMASTEPFFYDSAYIQACQKKYIVQSSRLRIRIHVRKADPVRTRFKPPREVDWLNAHSVWTQPMRIRCPVWTGLYTSVDLAR